MTFKGSLEKWEREKILSREMALYWEHLKNEHFEEIIIYSYSSKDHEILNLLNVASDLKKKIKLITPDKELFSFFDYFLHSISLRKIKEALSYQPTLCKTNQINGCWTGVFVRAWGVPFFLRSGYILSRRLFKNGNYIKACLALLLEMIAANTASLISVSTKDARHYLARLLVCKKKRIFIAPTYVDLLRFHGSIETKPKTKDLLYVGRLVPQKNVLILPEVAQKLGVPLTIVGNGFLKDSLLDRARQLNVDLTYHPFLDNEEIAALFKKHRYFILPSLHEGLPKILIEAMASEMICIGTDISGTRDLLQKETNGYLVPSPSVKDITAAVIRAFEDNHSDKRAKAARRYVTKHHSLHSYARREYRLSKKIDPP